MTHSYRTIAAATLVAVLIAGCAKQPPPPVAAPRPVKVEVVANGDSAGRETFVGTLRARRRADLGFEGAGRIADILVEVGDHVRSGQVLARLDEAPARWRLDKAIADRGAAAAALSERATQLEQNELLAEQKIISAAALKSVRTQHELAMGQLQAADAALSLAHRDLEVSRITAPYDGEIVGRLAQPHSDIGGGQPLLQIEAADALEAVAMLPDAVAMRLGPGATATIADASSPVRHLTLDRLSAHSDSGALVQAIFRVAAPTTGLRSGSVVSIELQRAATGGISIPAGALMPGVERGVGSVFVLDSSHNRIQRRSVKFADTLLPGGRVTVTAGLVVGDQVVVAGTAFLAEGQAAVRHDPQTLLHGEGA